MQNRKFLRSILALLAAGLFHGAPAAAATYCADNTQELVLALATAAQSAEDDEVRVRALTFNLTSNVVLSFRGSLTVSGGWTLNCLLQSQNPGATVITNTTPGAYSFVLRPDDGDLTVERLTFDRLDGVVLQDVGNAASVVGRITLARNRFIVNDFGPIVRVRDKGARIENNIITGSLQRSLQFDRSTATAPITADIHNNTLVGGTEGLRVTGTVGTVRLRNNVMDGDYGSGGIVIVDGVVTVNHNSLDGGFTYIGGASASPMFDNDLVIDPMFDANFVPQGGSPLINSGTNAIVGGLPSVDYAGATRRIGSRVDRGARECTVSDLSTLFVTSAADSGPGTLRQAILDANVTVIQESIEFDINGACPRTITLATTLPAISEGLDIDAFSQPGAAPNANANDAQGDNAVRCIVLVGAGTGIFNLTPGPNQEITLSGFGFVGASGAQVRINGVGRATLTGNGFNTGTSGVSGPLPQYAINIDGAPGTTVGGTSGDLRNLISGGSVAGIRLGPGSDRQVEGNFIGIAADGSSNVGNAIGVQIVDGNSDAIRDNWIGYSNTDGVRVAGSSTVVAITGNQIGNAPGGGFSGGTVAPNARNGVRIEAGTQVNINGNRINYSDGDGIVGLSAVRRLDISENQISANGGLGIDLGPDGVNPIDTDTAASGANAGQNYPVLSMASGSDTTGRLLGTLRSANGTYRIVAYRNGNCDQSGNGEGGLAIGSLTVTISNGTSVLDGEIPFNFEISRPGGLTGDDISAVATEVGGPDDGSSSEFSQCIAYAVTELFGNGFE